MRRALFLALLAATPAAAKPVLTVLQKLSQSFGGVPENAPIIGRDGVLYGTLYSSQTYGSIYSIHKDGTAFTVLYAFQGGAMGAGPFGQLVQGADGLFYGTTLFGGTSGQGEVYSFDPATTTLTVLHSFDFADGATPYGGLVMDAKGNFYGDTSAGGTAQQGTIFKIAAGTRAFSVLANLNVATGTAPFAALALGSDGMLYGAATGGGRAGFGTLLRVPPDGGGATDIHDFTGADGIGPFTALLPAPHAVFYGGTGVYASGGQAHYGNIFRFDAAHAKLTVLHTFQFTDGAGPTNTLTFDGAGRVLGTTDFGGPTNSGTIWRYDRRGNNFRVIYNFVSGVAGTTNAGLTYGQGGTFFGGTAFGGFMNQGTIFRFTE